MRRQGGAIVAKDVVLAPVKVSGTVRGGIPTFRGYALCRRVIPLRPGRPCPVATLGSPPGRSSGAAFRFAELQTQGFET